MDVTFKYTLFEYLDRLPIVDGQLIIIKDRNQMYYDLDNTRHPVEPNDLGKLVTLNTDQTITGKKTFENDVQIATLTQGQGCAAAAKSHAEGDGSNATTANSYAHAEGKNTWATGKYSHSEGVETSATGQGAHSSGKNSSATGDYSSTFGNQTSASGTCSIAAGGATTASNDYMTAIGLGNNPQPDDLFEVGNGSVLDSSGELLPESEQSFSNAFRVTKSGVAVAQTDVELSSGIKLSNREATSNKVTSITDSATDTQYPSALAVKKFVDNLPEPMIYKGTVGTGGTISTLPAAAPANNGFTYKVITDGTYAGQAAKAGDTFVSMGTKWDLIPSGDEPSGTVTNVAATGSNGVFVTGGPITTSGTLVISGVNATQSASGMMSGADKKKLDGIAAGAEVNQNAFAAITVGSTNVVADSASDTLTLVAGSNVTITPDAENDKITISATNTDTKVTAVGNHYAPVKSATKSAGGGTLTDIANSASGTQVVTGVEMDAAGHVTGLTSVALKSTNTTYSNATTSAPGLMSAEDKTKLNGIAAGANAYTLPTASATVKGGIKIGANLTMDGEILNAKDTTYSTATSSSNGLMSSTDKSKLDGIAAGANAYTHPTYTAKASGLYKVTVDNTGHVSATAAVVKADITALGIPSTNTTYSNATQSAAGLMSAADKIKLDGLSSNTVLTDDTTGVRYTLGVNNGVLYIKEVTG